MGTREYAAESQEVRDWTCRICPKNAKDKFHPWFFHIQQLAEMQQSGLGLTRDDVSENEARGLATWNMFHKEWAKHQYQPLVSIDQTTERKVILDGEEEGYRE